MERVDHSSLHFTDNGTFHDDLVLQLGSRQWVCDSYYLALDDQFMPGQEDVHKVREVLKRLLQQWHGAIAGLSEEGVCFLPFDFSDQSTFWLRCEACGPMLTIQPGWSAVEGWKFHPSNVGERLHNLPDFHEEGDAVLMTREAFLSCISWKRS